MNGPTIKQESRPGTEIWTDWPMILIYIGAGLGCIMCLVALWRGRNSFRDCLRNMLPDKYLDNLRQCGKYPVMCTLWGLANLLCIIGFIGSIILAKQRQITTSIRASIDGPQLAEN